jgi:hypothetical protein
MNQSSQILIVHQLELVTNTLAVGLSHQHLGLQNTCARILIVLLELPEQMGHLDEVAIKKCQKIEGFWKVSFVIGSYDALIPEVILATSFSIYAAR